MPATSTRWRAVGWALVMWSLAGCDLDPVYTKNLCGDSRAIISQNCQQCQKPAFAPQCPQCQDGQNPDCQNFGVMMSDSGVSSDAAVDSQISGAGGKSGGVAGKGVAGANGPSHAGAGSNAQAGTPGTGPISGAGTGGTPTMRDPSLCEHDSDCNKPTAACLISQQRCVECNDSSQCAGKACDTNAHRCVECTGDPDCPFGQVCIVSAQRCVECMIDSQCKDATRGTCSAAFKCVDCDSGRGCENVPTTPACVSQQCVQCDANTDCNDADVGSCQRSTHTCVECLTLNSECKTADRPVCEVDSNSCVQCLAASDCQSQHCVSKQCVDCETDANCLTAAKADCSSTNVCGKCTANSQCQHLTATQACETGSGTCVACVDDSTCGGFACIRSTHTCSTVRVGSVAACGTCTADSECMGANLKCVPLLFHSTKVGNYCLPTRPVAGCASKNSLSSRPYSDEGRATSIDGTAASYCYPPTTCEAVMEASARRSTCTVPADCGAPGLNGADAVCQTVNGCTYPCSVDRGDADCPTTGLSSCITGLCSPPPQ